MKKLVSSVPEIQPLYDEHMADHREMLPHVFFADLTAHIVTHAHDLGSHQWIAVILDHAEQALRNDDEGAAELIGVSLVENLIGEDAALKAVTPFMGPLLKAEIRRMGG